MLLRRDNRLSHADNASNQGLTYTRPLAFPGRLETIRSTRHTVAPIREARH